MKLSGAQAAEVDKYEAAYRSQGYRMGEARMQAALAALSGLPCRGALLDVGCGRGEMLAQAANLGFDPVCGAEVVSYLVGGAVVQAPAWDLPFADKSFDVVTMFDVIEHLHEPDGLAALRELRRVASRFVVITAANFSHVVGEVELHITRKPYADWDALIRRHVGPAATWLPRRFDACSETWVVEV
jgi:ubiquinone/menaquinone biosynthesis C-methylase UbiE